MKKQRGVILFFVCTALALTIILFLSGKQLAAGEESFSIFNTSSIWALNGLWSEVGTGFPNPTYLPRIPLSLVVRTLYIVGIPHWLSQSFIFFLIFLVGMISIFYLTKHFFRKVNSMVYFISALFYLFNLYTAFQVFGRFLYAGIFLWALIPASLLSWFLWIRKREVKYLAMFLIVSFVFSDAFLQPAHLFGFWTPIFVLTLFEFISQYKIGKKGVIRIILLSIIGIFLWVISNLWWLYPYLILGNNSFAEISDWKLNFESLRGVSQYFPTKEIILLRQSFLLGPWSIYYTFYSQIWIKILSYLTLFVTVVGLVKTRKEKYWIFLTITLLAGWFVSKGSNPPFGYEFFKFLFSTFPATAVLRNPYEKFGLVFLFPYSIFFALGWGWIYRKVNPKIKNPIVGTIFILSCMVLVFPVWTGNIYRNIRVKVPTYYEEVNNFLNEKKDDGRILALPLSPGDAVSYDWGYRGVEPSEFLFDRPSVSKILRTKYFDDKYWSLYDSFVNDKDYNKLLDEMNIRFLVLHEDVISEQTGASTSAQVRNILTKNKNITILEKFGELTIYEYNKKQDSRLLTIEGEDAPKINYQKLSPQKYQVSIEKASKPFNLIFKETFNPLWELKIDGQEAGKHFIVYNYANAWKIPKKGDYTLEIVFKVWPWD